MSALRPDYDDDPGRWRSWAPPQDVHEEIVPELRGPVLDVGCGNGKLAKLLRPEIRWVGLDSSPTQLAANPRRPVFLGDMRTLPFLDETFEEVTHLWCLYHVDDPAEAVREAFRVLRPGGRYYASTTARSSDPELIPEGYPRSSFDAEEAVDVVGAVFDVVEPDRWDGRFDALDTRDEVRAFCRSHYIPAERAESVALPLWLTKRGVLVRARKA